MTEYAYTSSLPKLGTFLKTKVERAKGNFKIADVFYGDQERIPRTPAVCIEPGEKDRTPNGLPRRTQIKVTLYLIVYHGKIADVRSNRLEDDDLAEQLEALVHADPWFKDDEGKEQVIDSLVTRVESGFQIRSNTIFRASRLTIEVTVQEQLPYPQEV